MKHSAKILFAVLDWGLGHASRSTPVIRELMAQGAEIILAGSGNSLELLRREFPDLQWMHLPGFSPDYDEKGRNTLKLLNQLPALYRSVKREHRGVLNMVPEIDATISDNRYGVYIPGKPSVCISHQLTLPSHPLQIPAQFFLDRLLAPFDHLWVPDTGTENQLSGTLGRTGKWQDKTSYLGLLSRFSPAAGERKHDLVAVISGPEPQRTIFQNDLLNVLPQIPGNHVLIRGVPGEEKTTNGNVTVVDWAYGRELEAYLHAARVVVCRSGYSSMMDLAVMGRKAVIIPTPGQPEQTYLASRARFFPDHFRVTDDLSELGAVFRLLRELPDPPPLRKEEQLKRCVNELLLRCSG